MKKLLIFLLLCVTCFAGCRADSSSKILEGKLVEIENGLWYDSVTRIVYFWNGRLDVGYYSSTTPSAYYAPNGFPYRYNPETEEFEEIDNGCKNECCLPEGGFSE